MDAWRYGYRSRINWKNQNYAQERKNFENYLVEIAEVALLRLVIIFLEDAPIVVLNLAQLFQSELLPEGWAHTVHGKTISITYSLFTLTWQNFITIIRFHDIYYTYTVLTRNILLNNYDEIKKGYSIPFFHQSVIKGGPLVVTSSSSLMRTPINDKMTSN